MFFKHKNLKKIQGDITNFHDVIKAIKGSSLFIILLEFQILKNQ